MSWVELEFHGWMYHPVLLCTQSAIPHSDSIIPIQVSVAMVEIDQLLDEYSGSGFIWGRKGGIGLKDGVEEEGIGKDGKGRRGKFTATNYFSLYPPFP